MPRLTSDEVWEACSPGGPATSEGRRAAEAHDAARRAQVNHNPHELSRRLFGHDVDKVGHVLYYELEQRHGVGNVVKRIENDPSFTLGVEYGILAALDKLARMGVITEMELA